MFAPEDIRIVRDGPAFRRRFMDMQLSQIRPRYVNALKHYLTVLESRNALLKGQRQHPMEDFETQIETWDEQLASAAVFVAETRRWFLESLCETAAARYASISEDSGEVFRLGYAGPLARADQPYRVMLEGLKRTRNEDLYRLFTAFGPHRDDITLRLCGKDLRAYGSQGQLRTAMLSMKLGEIALIERESGESPALLLDDVFSELDGKRRNALLRCAQSVQTFITCTDKRDVAGIKAQAFLHVRRDGSGSATIEDQ
jgi:DNA replication and repair protein RecF